MNRGQVSRGQPRPWANHTRPIVRCDALRPEASRTGRDRLLQNERTPLHSTPPAPLHCTPLHTTSHAVPRHPPEKGTAQCNVHKVERGRSISWKGGLVKPICTHTVGERPTLVNTTSNSEVGAFFQRAWHALSSP